MHQGHASVHDGGGEILFMDQKWTLDRIISYILRWRHQGARGRIMESDRHDPGPARSFSSPCITIYTFQLINCSCRIDP
jgi:hypothetical protein